MAYRRRNAGYELLSCLHSKKTVNVDLFNLESGEQTVIIRKKEMRSYGLQTINQETYHRLRIVKFDSAVVGRQSHKAENVVSRI